MFAKGAQDRVPATDGQSSCADNLRCSEFEVLGDFNDGDPLTFDFFDGGLSSMKDQHGVWKCPQGELAITLSPWWLQASKSVGIGPWRRLKFDP